MATRDGTGLYAQGKMPFIYQLLNNPHRTIVVDVPIDLTPEEEAQFRRLFSAQAFGTLVESIADERARYPHKFVGAPGG